MKAPPRIVALFLVLPAPVFAHGTEVGGLWIGSLASVIFTATALALLPSRPGRKSVVFGAAIAAIIAIWILVFAGVGDAIYFSIRQSVVPWILLGLVPPLSVASAVYYFVSRPLPQSPSEKNA